MLITLPSVDRDQRQNLAKGGMSNRTPSLSRLTSGFGYVDGPSNAPILPGDRAP